MKSSEPFEVEVVLSRGRGTTTMLLTVLFQQWSAVDWYEKARPPRVVGPVVI